jgi:hypothetical protein
MRFNRQGMDFASDALAQRAIDALVARQRTLTRKFGADDQCFEVCLILRSHLDLGARERGADQLGNLLRMHGLCAFLRV